MSKPESNNPNTTRWTIRKYLLTRYVPAKNLTDRTVKFYLDSINALERFVGRPVRLHECTDRMLEKFILWCVKRGLTNKTSLSRVHNLKGILRHWNPERFPIERLNHKVEQPRFIDADMDGTLDHVMVNLYLPERMTITSAGTIMHYNRAIRLFGQLLERPARVTDLTDNNVGRFLRWLVEVRGLKPVSANAYAKQLKALWTWLGKKGLKRNFPTVQDLPEPQVTPHGWSRDDLGKLMDGCHKATGTMRGVPAAAYWVAFHYVLWDTGERSGAMLALRWDWLDWKTGNLSVPAEYRKGRKVPMVYPLKPATLDALRAIVKPERDIIFETPPERDQFWRRYKLLVIRSGLKYEKGKTGPQKMRRTFASYIEAAGGNATKALKHRDRRVTEDSYLDPRITDVESENQKLFPLEGENGDAA